MENNNQENGLAIASLVCGISSITLMCCCSFLGIGAGVAGIITGFKSANEVGERSTMAKTGIIISILALVLCVIYTIVMMTSDSSAIYHYMGYYLED